VEFLAPLMKNAAETASAIVAAFIHDPEAGKRGVGDTSRRAGPRILLGGAKFSPSRAPAPTSVRRFDARPAWPRRAAKKGEVRPRAWWALGRRSVGAQGRNATR